MSASVAGWLAQLVAVDAPALPSAWLMHGGLCLGWSVVLAWLGAWGARRMAIPGPAQGGVALVLAISAWIPGPYAPTYWLGLAFQAPSLVTVLLCAWLLHARFLSGASGLNRASGSLFTGPAHHGALALAVVAVLVGWALLLDTFALLPLPLYAWGFSPVATALVLLAILVPWLVGNRYRRVDPRVWLAALAVLVYVALRLPTGNVWDAMLDPWLWVGLHGYVFRKAVGRY